MAKTSYNKYIKEGRKMKVLTHDEVVKELLIDPEFKKEYDALEAEYELIDALIKARAFANVTQKELAKRSGIDQANISKIETGVYSPTINTLKKLADGLNMKLKIEFIQK